MSIYIVNCDKLQFFKTFESLDEALNFLDKKNKKDFDGKLFSIFGRGMRQSIVKGDDMSELWTYEWVDAEYYVDSVVLCTNRSERDYFTFYIRCINSKGESIELL